MQLLSVLGTAAGAVAQVILIAFVGVVAAFFPREQPLLTPEALRPISRIANDIFLPFLSAAVLGARINGAALREDWVLLPAGLCVTVLGYAVADVTALFARPSPALLPALRVAVAHPNAFALPLLLLRYLCERPVVNAEFGGDDEECLERGAAKLCVFLTAWHVIFWTYAYSTLERIDGGAGREASARLWLRRALLQPNMIGVYAGVLIGVSPLRRLLFFGATPLRPLGLAVETLGEPVVATTVSVWLLTKPVVLLAAPAIAGAAVWYASTALPPRLPPASTALPARLLVVSTTFPSACDSCAFSSSPPATPLPASRTPEATPLPASTTPLTAPLPMPTAPPPAPERAARGSSLTALTAEPAVCRGYVGELETRTGKAANGADAPAGSTNATRYFLFTHLDFSIAYNAEHIIEVNVSADPLQRVDLAHPGAREVDFSYSVRWVASSVPYAERMSRYAQYSFLPQSFEIHWLSIINSFVLVRPCP